MPEDDLLEMGNAVSLIRSSILNRSNVEFGISSGYILKHMLQYQQDTANGRQIEPITRRICQ